jgi:beta-phosphoglucomutase
MVFWSQQTIAIIVRGSRWIDEEHIPFTRADNERLRGVSRMASLEIVLEKAARAYSEEEKLALAERKNCYYVQLIRKLTDAAI